MISKIVSIAMLPFGLVIILEELGFFSLDLFFDKVLIGAALMVVVQVLTLISLNMHHQNLRIVNLVTFVILVIPAVLYFLTVFTSFSFEAELPLILGTMMTVEALYAFH